MDVESKFRINRIELLEQLVRIVGKKAAALYGNDSDLISIP